MIVLDANILVRAVLGRRARQLIDAYAGQGVRLLAPDAAFADAEKYLPSLLERRGIARHESDAAIAYLRTVIDTIDPDAYGEFESDARRRLRGRDEDDWPILAAALALACAIWTEDADFFGTGIATWTTANVEIFLQKEARADAT
jgi:predicted nucleic acid-binding protein